MTLRLLVGLAILIGVVVGTSACGDKEPGAAGSSDAPAPVSASPQGTQLTIRYAVDGDLTATVTTMLDCTTSPVTGSVADPNRTCAALAAAGADAFDPVPVDQQCTLLFGGPEHGIITGSVEGERVEAHLTRTIGCEIARYDEAVVWGLLPAAAVAGAPIQ